MAPPGAQRAGQDRGARRRPATDPRRRLRGRRRHPGGRPPRSPARPAARQPAPLAPGHHRRHRDRQDDTAAPAVGRRSWPSGLQLHAAGQAGPPLLVVLDCKGGADARRIADRCRRVLRESGARNVAVWPDEARLSLWSLPVRQLVTTLVDLIEHGTGGAAYYADVMEAVVALAVEAPGGPPAQTAEFLSRLDADWLALAWLGDEDRLVLARSAARQVPDIALRFRTLFRRLGAGLDGPGSFAAADAWYCILEGTAEISVAEAQARALVDLLASYVAGAAARPARTARYCSPSTSSVPCPGGCPSGSCTSAPGRSASRCRCRRSPGMAWPRARTTGTGSPRRAEGGIWLFRTPHPDPVTALAGQRTRLDSTRQLTGRLRWSRAGTSRVAAGAGRRSDLIRGLDIGQAAYLYRGGVTYILVKRLVAGPALRWRRRTVGGGPVSADVRPRPAVAAAGDGRSRHRHRRRCRTCRRSWTRRSGRRGVPDDRPVHGAGPAPPSAELTDDDVRAAWRRVAAATHPDRADGGDPAAFAAAAAAYTLLRTAAGARVRRSPTCAQRSGETGVRRPRSRPGPRLPGLAAVLASRSHGAGRCGSRCGCSPLSRPGAWPWPQRAGSRPAPPS